MDLLRSWEQYLQQSREGVEDHIQYEMDQRLNRAVKEK